MRFPSTTAILSDPDIWVGDSAASTHSTAHLQGLTNIIQGQSSDNIQVGNSAINQVKFIGDIKGTFYNQFGDTQASATLMGVSYS